MFLVDTNVVSELRKLRPHGAAVAWIKAQDESHLFIAAVTLAEIQTGIERTRRQDAAKADELEGWLDDLALTANVIAMEGADFRRWARLMHRTSDALAEDAMIAATALVHKLTVVTRDTRDFEPTGVPLLNPWLAEAGEPG